MAAQQQLIELLGQDGQEELIRLAREGRDAGWLCKHHTRIFSLLITRMRFQEVDDLLKQLRFSFADDDLTPRNGQHKPAYSRPAPTSRR